MRLANEQDQAIIRSAIADSSASTLSFLSSMGQREAIAFGEGVATTMRMKFEKIPLNLLPGAGRKAGSAVAPGNPEDIDLVAIVERLRNVPKVAPALPTGEPVSPRRQAGESEFRKPVSFSHGGSTDPVQGQRPGAVTYRPTLD
jgi:hypothetical protein